MIRFMRRIGMLVPAELRLIAVIFGTVAASMALAVMLHDSLYPKSPMWQVYQTARRLDPENRFAARVDWLQIIAGSPTLSGIAATGGILLFAIVVMRISGTGFRDKRDPESR